MLDQDGFSVLHGVGVHVCDQSHLDNHPNSLPCIHAWAQHDAALLPRRLEPDSEHDHGGAGVGHGSAVCDSALDY